MRTGKAKFENRPWSSLLFCYLPYDMLLLALCTLPPGQYLICVPRMLPLLTVMSVATVAVATVVAVVVAVAGVQRAAVAAVTVAVIAVGALYDDHRTNEL